MKYQEPQTEEDLVEMLSQPYDHDDDDDDNSSDYPDPGDDSDEALDRRAKALTNDPKA